MLFNVAAAHDIAYHQNATNLFPNTGEHGFVSYLFQLVNIDCLNNDTIKSLSLS